MGVAVSVSLQPALSSAMALLPLLIVLGIVVGAVLGAIGGVIVSRIERLVCLFLRDGDRPARRDPDTGEMVLATGRSFLALFGLLALIGSLLAALLIAGLLIRRPPEGGLWFGPDVVLAALLLLGGLGSLRTLKARVHVSTKRVRAELPLSRPTTIAWSEVAAVRFSNNGTLMLVAEDKRRVAIGAIMVGAAEFAEMLGQHLPSRVQEDCRRELDKFRVFLRV